MRFDHSVGIRWLNKRHAMHAEAMTFHKGSLRIFRKFDRKFQES